MGDMKAIHARTETLKKFDNQSHTFRAWSRHIVDHMAMVHVDWRDVLEDLSKTSQDLSRARLATMTIGPFRENADELSVKMEQ